MMILGITHSWSKLAEEELLKNLELLRFPPTSWLTKETTSGLADTELLSETGRERSESDKDIVQQ